MKSKLLVRLIVSVSFCVSFVVSVSSQSPLWIYGNKLIHFSETGITTSNLPQPGVDLDLHYTGQIPTRGQNCQFDNQGNLLFFIIDGNIYDREGYIMARYNESDSNPSNLPFLNCSSGNIGITTVPGYCDKFYIFSNVQSYSESTSFYSLCSVLDLGAQNPFFPNDLSRKGTLIDLDTQFDDSAPFHYLYESNIPIVNLYSNYSVRLSGELGAKKCLDSYEIIEISQDHKILLIGSLNDGIIIYDFTPNALSLIYNCAQNNSGGEQTTHSCIKSFPNAGGDYLIASTSDCTESQLVSQDILILIKNLNLQNGISNLQEINISPAGNDKIVSFEFSPDGSKLWFTKIQTPYLGYCDLNTGVVSTINTPSIDQSLFSISEMEGQKDELGNNVIYLSSASGLYKLTNPNTPSQSLITAVSWANGIAPCIGNAINLLQQDLVYTLQVQNTGTPIIQDYLAGSSCCHDYVVIHDDAPTQINTSIDGNWYNGQNPFQNQSSPIKIVNDLVFQTGTVTHIYNMTFEFDVNADVIIQKGASVYLHGTTWTSLDCENIMWPGVDLLGTTNSANTIDQLPVSGGDQGYLNLTNSVIENAMVGIDVGGNIPSNAGGIVRASQSTFRNNYNDVIFKKYRFEIGGDPVQNKSYFNLCTFITDEHLNNPSLSPNNHVLLKSVDKISFENCSFMNKTDINTYNWFNRGTGIYSSRASFTVDGSNDTWSGSPVDSEQTTFYKLQYGIRSAGYNDPDAFYTCKEQEFQYCLYGIVNYNTDNVLIYLNNFVLPDAAGFNSNETVERGIYLTNSTGYVVEQNTFDGFDDFQVNDEFPCALGIWVDNSGDASNEIRNNDFNEMKLGTYVTRQNRDFVTGINGTVDVGGIDDQTGLQLFCNTYTNGQTDIFRDSETYMRWVQGGMQQNGTFKLAGNRFSADDCSGVISDFVCDPYNDEHLDYWCHADLNTTPDCGGIADHPVYVGPLLTNAVIPTSYDEADCPNTFVGIGGVGQTPGSIGGIIAQLTTVRNQLIMAKSTYNAVVDDNQKQSTIDILNEAFPHESQYYRDLLSSRYPLSDEVLSQLIAQANRLSSWHLTEVFLANSPLRKEMLAQIERSQILSPFFMNFLYNANSGTSLRKLMEINITEIATNRDKLIQKLAQSGFTYESDPELETDQLIYLNDYLNQINQSDAVVMIRSRASYLASRGNYTGAISLIENEQSLANFKKILEIEQSITSEWSLLSASQIAELWSIYNQPNDFSSSMALGILQEIGESDFEPEPRVPIQHRSIQLKNENEENTLPLLGVWPNPASEAAWLQYPIEAEEHTTIEVYDPQGRLLNSFHPNTNGLVKLSLKNYESGIYVVQLSAFDKVVESIKLTVVNQK